MDVEARNRTETMHPEQRYTSSVADILDHVNIDPKPFAYMQSFLMSGCSSFISESTIFMQDALIIAAI